MCVAKSQALSSIGLAIRASCGALRETLQANRMALHWQPEWRHRESPMAPDKY